MTALHLLAAVHACAPTFWQSYLLMVTKWVGSALGIIAFVIFIGWIL